MSEIQKQNRKRNHDKNNGSCVAKKGDKMLQCVFFNPCYIVILVFPYLRAVAYCIGLLNKICGMILCKLHLHGLYKNYMLYVAYNLLVGTWISAILAVGLLCHTHRQIDRRYMLDLEYSICLSTPCAHHIIFAWNRPTNSWGIYAAKCAHFTIQKGICRPGSV